MRRSGKGKLLGFRSGVPWKKLAAVLYYLLCITVLLCGIMTPPLIPCNAWDAAVFRISACFLSVWMVSPAIVLSNTVLRKRLPLFKAKDFTKSLVGIMLLFVLCSWIFGWIEGWHTESYKNNFEQYITESYKTFVESGEKEY